MNRLSHCRDAELRDRIARRCGINISVEDARTLRRAELTLGRWFALECGDGNNYASWAIERDPDTDKPYMVRYPHDRAGSIRTAIPDREDGARRRIAKVCERHGLHYYVQTDPRGTALYVAAEPLRDTDYSSRGVSCAV